MTDTAVTRFPGVNRRKDSAVWWFVLRAPKDLAHHFPGTPWAVRCSLGTTDLRTANEKARTLHAEWAQRFASLRAQDNPVRVESISPELRAAIAAGVRHAVLMADENMRRFPEGPAGLLAMYARKDGKAGHDTREIPGTVRDPLAGLSAAELDAVVRFNAEHAGRVGRSMAAQRVRDVQELAEGAARRLGLTVADWMSGSGLDTLRACLAAYRQAVADAVRRDAGEVVDTPAEPVAPPPPVPAAPAVPDGRRMRDALEAWEGLKPRKPKTLSVFRRHVEQFAAMTGDPLLSDIGHAEAERFREALQRWAVENGKTKKTADNVLSSIKALATVAANRARAWMPVNPFAGLSVEVGGKEAEGREPWTPEELPRLFASPIFRAYRVPPGDTSAERKAGLDAAYWVPLLCLFTGARPGEVCQLWTDDLSEVTDSEGRPLLVLEIRANKERGQSLKNPSSWRALPVHSELIRLGFRDYWQAIAERHGKPGPLFPALQVKGANGHAGQFGQWFGEFKKAQGFNTTKTLHSFRHTVETELAFAEVSATLVDAITGHEGQGIGRKQYGATIRRQAVRLRPHIERLTFPGLDLPKRYTAPAWTPGPSQEPT